MSTGYFCKTCGCEMEWEDKWERFLVCTNCGDSRDLEEEAEEDEDYPLEEEVTGEYDDDEDGDEYYDEEFNELDD